jgi:hypothetical protein
MNPTFIISVFLGKSIKIIKSRIICFLIACFLFFFIPIVILAQTPFFDPQGAAVDKNTDFSLPLKINSISNLFGVNFDLNFDPTMFEYIGATEGGFLSQGCGTSLMVAPGGSGRIIFGLTRLGSSCGGVSGSGMIATINFRSLGKEGAGTFSFSNNSLCILSGSSCTYAAEPWPSATVTVMSEVDTAPPVRSAGVPSGTLPFGTTETTMSLTTNENAVCRFSTAANIAYAAMTNNFSSTGGANHSVVLTGLTSGTSYSRYVRCQDSVGNANPDDYLISFSVNSDTVAPIISAVAISLITHNSATIAWATNEASDSQVEYGLTANYGSETAVNNSMVASHSLPLSGLAASTLYHYRVKSRDAAGNLAVSQDYTFSTVEEVVVLCSEGNGAAR